VTHENPIGLVQIKLPMPLDCDAERVREILLRAFAEHESVMDTPAPNVLLDGIDNGNLMFNATGFVGSPRQSSGVRSALLFRVLQDLREAGQPMWRAPSLVLREPPPPTETSSSPVVP
jgi:small-conductance mechanosensitive channel